MEESLFCIKDVRKEGFRQKHSWFDKRYAEGLRMKILKNDAGKMISFIEYVPTEYAWRPVKAENYMFIQCMYSYSNKEKRKGYGSMLVRACEEDARTNKKDGVAVMTSEGAWMTGKRLFEKNGYTLVASRDRFDLLVKKFNIKASDPELIDWYKNRTRNKGWTLVYADQCPWHDKSVRDLSAVAAEHKIELKLRKLRNAREAKNAPSGFGVFSLMRDDRLLEDHYISQTRFRNILKKELGNS